MYDSIIIGAGACGIMSAIISARKGKKVLLLEKLPKIASKLRASGGGRCNLTNTLSNQDFMNKFGKNGRFMRDALNNFDSIKLREFFKEIGVETHSADGFRIFPLSHSSSTIIEALQKELNKLNVEIKSSQIVLEILTKNSEIIGVKTDKEIFYSNKIVLATGGAGYPMLGTNGDGYNLSEKVGHKITEIFPAMMPLQTKESWVANCIADTVGKVEIKVNLKKYKNLKAKGDLIFTRTGIRGPVVLDFAREITPLLSKQNEIPILLNFMKGMKQEEILNYLNKQQNIKLVNSLNKLIPKSLITEILKLANIDENKIYKDISKKSINRLIELLSWTPLTINGHNGFKMAMVTRGGVSLKEVNPKTMESKIIKGLYFCGEVLDIDGPCGGYNLQWSFSSGYLSGNF